MLMDRYGAQAIFDENSVLLADQTLNITAAVIAEIDASRRRRLPGAGTRFRLRRSRHLPPRWTPVPRPPAGAADQGGN